MTQITKSIGLLIAAGLILAWNVVVAVVEFVLETSWDILFILKKAGVFALGFGAAALAYLFAGIKMPAFKLPKIELPDVRIPQLDLEKKDRVEIPHIQLSHQEPVVEEVFEDIQTQEDPRKERKNYWSIITSKVRSILFYTFPLPDYVTKHRKITAPQISLPQAEVLQREYHVLPQGPSFKTGGLWLLGLFTALSGLIVVFVKNILNTVSGFTYRPKQLKMKRQLRESTKIYDKTGEVLLYDVFKEERRTVVPLSEVSVNLQNAILATEDDKFYDHHGVRVDALVRSVVNKIKDPNSRLAGGSTITQQVIKNAILTNERAVERKVKEWVLAWRLENQLSKREILEAYFIHPRKDERAWIYF